MSSMISAVQKGILAHQYCQRLVGSAAVWLGADPKASVNPTFLGKGLTAAPFSWALCQSGIDIRMTIEEIVREYIRETVKRFDYELPRRAATTLE